MAQMIGPEKPAYYYVTRIRFTYDLLLGKQTLVSHLIRCILLAMFIVKKVQSKKMFS